MLFSFLNISPRKELRIRKQGAAKINRKYKYYEGVKKERTDRYFESLSVHEVVSEVLRECVTAVCHRERNRKRG